MSPAVGCCNRAAHADLAVCACRYGFIVMDGSGSLFGTLSGNTREVMHKFTVDLPKKHGRGGQSALRFARLRMEKRHNYVRKVGWFWVDEQAVLQWKLKCRRSRHLPCSASQPYIGPSQGAVLGRLFTLKVKPGTQRAQLAHLQLACDLPPDTTP